MVTFVYGNREYDLPSLTLSIEGNSFNINDALNDFTEEGEMCRLYLELLPHNGGTIPDIDGGTINIPARAEGIDILTANGTEIVNFIKTPPFELSEANRSFIRRVIAWRFPVILDSQIQVIDPELQTEYTLIKNHSKSKKFLGEAGFFKTLRLDGTKV